MEKLCKGCGKVKSLQEFSPAGKYYQSKCKHCLKLASRKWRKDNPERTRYTQAKSKLNIDDENYQRISQVKKCEICGNSPLSLQIDHNHKTNVFRGALCANCNHGIGKFKDSTTILGNAIKYLEKYDK